MSSEPLRGATIVFAGAGASTAVNPEQYPTTAEFFRRLPEDISSAQLFKLATDFLQQRHRVDTTTLDVELVLGVLAEFAEFTKELRDERSVPGWILRDGRLANIVDPQQNYNNVLNGVERAEPQVRRLIEE